MSTDTIFLLWSITTFCFILFLIYMWNDRNIFKTYIVSFNFQVGITTISATVEYSRKTFKIEEFKTFLQERTQNYTYLNKYDGQNIYITNIFQV